MKALVFDEQLRLAEIPKPKPGTGEALVKVTMAGICRTDVEITKGYMGFRGVPGHEFVGMVESSPLEDLNGKRVVGEINAGCGQCPFCLKGLQRHCPTRSVLGILARNGALAEYLTLPVSNLVPVPDAVSDEKAVFAEPLAAAIEILEQVRIDPSWRVLILGDGKLGLLISMVLRLTGAEIVMVGKHREKLEIVTRFGGSAIPLNDLKAHNDKFDLVVEASGSPSGWDLAGARVKPRGIIVLKSTYHGSFQFNTAPLVIDEITVVGSRCGPFRPALRLLEYGLVDPTPLISKVFPFDEAVVAFELAQKPENLKILLRM